MNRQVFEVVEPGLGMSLQDRGRFGWRRFGVPVSGAMDDHAAGWANRLLDNPLDAPVLEILLQGAQLTALENVWIAVTGADAEASVPLWRATRVEAGDTIEFPHQRHGVWIYLAVEGGFASLHWLGSASVYARGQLGKVCGAGDILQRSPAMPFELPSGVAGRAVSWTELRRYDTPPPLRVWPGPQWDFLSDADRTEFFLDEWTVTSQSDRVGYRLAGAPLKPAATQILSEPVRVGTIQIPENGQPIVTMRDGPTVGGYPKLGMIDPADVSWLAQCRPGQKARFQSLHEP